jgi:hypothetical protein
VLVVVVVVVVVMKFHLDDMENTGELNFVERRMRCVVGMEAGCVD